MALLKQINGNRNAVLEVNFLAARRTGQVKGQLPLDTDVFSVDNPAENGMLLIYDAVAGHVTTPESAGDLAMLHFSVEKEYHHLFPGLRTFATTPEGFYPRLYALHAGDTWTTDAVEMGGTTDEEVEDALEALDPADGNLFTVSTDGWVDLSSAAGGTEDLLLKVIAKTTLPNGGYAVKLEVVKATV